ncbi:MAG: OmpA family protein [Nitrospirales bacterium]|nr:OmpA family protein [Nitrospira sp.]MDR4502207.1 OmpA family protein [Nitrospirales bacterium]
MTWHRKLGALIGLFLLNGLFGCQSMVTHEYGEEKSAFSPATPFAAPDLQPIPDIAQTRSEVLQEEPIRPLGSPENLPMLTPASYYHSPDPPKKLPEYVPSLFFAFDSWRLTDKGKHVLELTAAQLRDNPKASLLIEGHCDDRGSEEYNLVLGDKRALAIRDYLLDLGVSQDRLMTVSFGDAHPVCFEDHESCHALNRRGYLVLLDPHLK